MEQTSLLTFLVDPVALKFFYRQEEQLHHSRPQHTTQWKLATLQTYQASQATVLEWNLRIILPP